MSGYFLELKQFLSELLSTAAVKAEQSGAFGGSEERQGEEREGAIKQIPKMFLKELKISGRIGDLDDKDTLSYTSFSYKLRSAKMQGYSDKKIMSAVIKSINPSLELRAYLEGRTNLTYQSLTTTLRSRYKELDVPSLFTTLSTRRQLGHENAQEFTMRLMTLKQKILFVSQEDPCGYSPELVQSVNSVEPTQEKEKKENPIMKEISELKAQVLANFRQSQPIRHDGRWTNCIKMAPIIAIIGLFAFQVNI